MRLRIDLAYDGGDFHGWATQPGLRTVQELLAAALATALRIRPGDPDGRVELICAGRTDAGVHARGQVVHVEIETHRIEQGPRGGPGRLVRRLNGILPSDVRVRAVTEALPGFDARFSALWRRYAYRVGDHPGRFDPLLRHHVTEWPRRLDLDAMREASGPLLGLHDFASFCRRREGATTIRTLLDLDVARDEDGLVVLGVRADAFCHTMVRSLVGTLLAVGEGRQEQAWVVEVLDSRRRRPDTVVAPARGLTLEEVRYPDAAGLAERAEQTRARRRAEDLVAGGPR